MRVLKAARRSGLYSLWAGWDTDCADTLEGFRAAGKQGRDRIEAVKRVQGEGIEVVLFVMLGSRDDGLDAFERTLQLADRLRVGIHPVLTTPLPGTELYERYRPHLLPGLGWEAFTGVRAVFEHTDAAATPERREREYHELVRERTPRLVTALRHVAGTTAVSTALAWLAAHLDLEETFGERVGAMAARFHDPIEVAVVTTSIALPTAAVGSWVAARALRR